MYVKVCKTARGRKKEKKKKEKERKRKKEFLSPTIFAGIYSNAFLDVRMHVYEYYSIHLV